VPRVGGVLRFLRELLRKCANVRAAVAFVILIAASLPMACSLGPHDTAQPETSDARAPTILDRIRSINLSPRAPRPAETDSLNSVNQARPLVYNGNDQSPVVQINSNETPKSGDGYNLNFENAPVSTVAKVILGDILNEGYTIDPRVQASVSLASGRPVPKSDILFVLENALRLSNIALIHDQSGYRLTPVSDAIGTGKAETRLAEAGYGITVIPLQYVSVQTIVKLLDSFAIKPGMVRADAARNLVLIQGTGSERRAALETVASFDADWMQGESVAIYPVHNSTPEPVVAELEKIMDSGENGLNHNLLKVQAISRMNAILVVSKKSALLKTAGTWISRLDKSVTAATNLKVYRLRYGNARQVAALLNDIFVGRGSTTLESATNQIAPNAGISTSSSSAPMTTPSLGGLPPQTSTLASLGVRTTSQGTTSESMTAGGRREPGAAESNIGSGATPDTGPHPPGILPGVRITADVVNNSLLVYADGEAHRIIAQTLRQIDRPQAQVAIDMTIAEVTLNDQLNYGVQFFLKSSDLGLKSDVGSMINTIGGAILQQQFPGFNFLIGSNAQPRFILDALHNITDVKVLSNPSLVVLDNQPATLQIGDEVPVSTGSATVLTTNNTIVNTIQYMNTGIIMRIVPRTTSNGNVVLDITQETSNVAAAQGTTNSSTSNGQPNLNPTISQRRVQSTISVASGQTVLLAGLISETVDRVRQGIPVLDQIPGFIGDAFSHQDKSRKRTELIIFIRPQIIRDNVDASVVAEELRTKLNGRFVGSNLPGLLGTLHDNAHLR
jgi:general secretion pathway protein D